MELVFTVNGIIKRRDADSVVEGIIDETLRDSPEYQKRIENNSYMNAIFAGFEVPVGIFGLGWFVEAAINDPVYFFSTGISAATIGTLELFKFLKRKEDQKNNNQLRQRIGEPVYEAYEQILDEIMVRQ